MKNHHPDNERIKRRYRDYLKEANGYSEASLDQVNMAISRFETYTKFRDFKAFRPEQAKAFKARLADQLNARTGEKLSKATLHSTLRSLRAFFKWLAGQTGYRSKLTYSDSDFFNLSDNDVRTAKARREPAFPTLEQIRAVLAKMPATTDIELRNRAMLAFTILTGARDGALATFKLKHLDLDQATVFHDPRDMSSKRAKTFTTWFFPVGDEPVEIVTAWVRHLRDKLLWGDADPLFPKTKVGVGATGTFEPVGLERACWSSAQPIRHIFREAFEAAGLQYFNPHSFRHTLAKLGERICPTIEMQKAWSQNLGHENLATTTNSYGGSIPAERQAELIRGLWKPPETKPDLANLITRAVQAGLAAQRGHIDSI
jgi:integrase